MERNHDIVEIGTASTDTKGPGGPIIEFMLGQMVTGMSLD